MAEQHAELAPSSAARWLNCTPSAVLEAAVPDRGSDFAREGTLAHAMAALRLKRHLCQDTMREETEIAALSDEYYSGEMDEHVDTYTAIVLERYAEACKATPDAELIVETRLDLSRHIPGAFGTADAIIVADGWMEVIDLKYGKGVEVSAEKNPQMMIYALGAYDLFEADYRMNKIRMAIVQPRIGNFSSWTTEFSDLHSWRSYVLLPKAALAHQGTGAQLPGEWCRFCRVKATCRALATQGTAVTEAGDPRLLTPAELATKVLPIVPVIKSWIAGVEEYALDTALSGTALPGFKIVEGRSTRKVVDPDRVRRLLNENGYDYDSYMKAPELRGLTDLEKLVGKKRLTEICGDCIVKPAGKPTLVPADDKRPPFDAASADFKDFNL